MECNERGVAEGNRTSMWVDKRTTEAYSETWWWNDEVAKAIEEKRRCYKVWHITRTASDQNKYKEARRNARSVALA